MSSVSILKNKFDGNDYRVSIVPVRKRASIPNPLRKTIPKEYWHSMSLEPMSFDNIIFEAAIFSKKKYYKPLFSIELDEYSNKTTEEEFTKFIHHIIMNEKIEDLMHGVLDIYYDKYDFIAAEHNMWNLFFLSKIKIVFIRKAD